MGGFAWVTLATNDSYALGALVLAHSLRRAGTPHDLVALVTPGVSAAMRNQLSSIFTLVQEVNILDSRDEAHLALLERPELGITFTKLHCWRLTQYEKCVFLDADILVLKNSDELFEREELSAAPDPGWPDCFNSGVFVYRPSLDTFNALIKFALSKGSFDGGDQGLLNSFFSDWATKDISRHLPFIYNMVSTATYSYLPAYKQFGENAKIVHFIGANKPWLQYFDSETRLVRSPDGAEHLQALLQLWWDIFCSTVHPTLSPEMLGLAGALAQLTLGAPRSAEQAAFEEHMRKQAWEQGNMDYMGRDSFDNIWRKISETLAEVQEKPETQIPEIPPTKSASEPKLPESKVPEPKSRTSPPADSKEAPSSTGEPTPGLQSSIDTIPSFIPPDSITLPESISVESKSSPVVPHTPSIIEATPPTSPPIVVPTAPVADIQALKVDAPPPETPPVGSVTSELVSTTKPTSAQTEKPLESAVKIPQDIKSLDTESLGLEKPIVIEQKQSAETIEAPSQDMPILKEVTPTQEQAPQEIPVSLEVEKVVESAAPEILSPPKESPVSLGEQKTVDSTILTQVSPSDIPKPSGDEKVLGSTVPEVPVSVPKEIPVSSGAEKIVDSTVPEVPPPTQVSAPSETDLKVVDSTVVEVQTPSKESPIPSGDEKVVGSTVPEIQSSQSVSTPVKSPVAKEDEKVVSSTVPEVLATPETEITSKPLTSENVISTTPSQDVSTPVVSEKTVSSTVPEVPTQPQTSVEDEKVIVAPLPQLVSAPKEDTSAATTKKVVSPAAPDVSVPKETTAPVVAVPEVQPSLISTSKKTSLPEPSEEPSSAPIVADVAQQLPVSSHKEIPQPPSDKAATPLAGAPSEPKREESASVPQEPSKETPANVAAPVIPPVVPVTPTEKVSAKPELPVSPPQIKDKKQAAAIPAQASKSPTGDTLDSKESKSNEKQVLEESKAPTSPTKSKDSSKSVGKKPVEPKETAQSPPVSPPQTPDAPPSDQAPVPPKRRGHKGTSAEQGAASKPAQPQPQQTKGSKPGQKGKK